MKEALLKAGVEALRVVTLAIIPVAILSLEAWAIDWKVIIIVGGVAFLRLIDKFLHELGKANDNKVLLKGITQF